MGEDEGEVPINIDLTPIQKQLLTELYIGGERTPKHLVDHVDTSRQYATEMLKDLESQGLVTNTGHGVYQLTIDGLIAARALITEVRGEGSGPDVRNWFG